MQSTHESSWLSKVKVIHGPCSKVTRIQHCQTYFPLNLGWLKPNFIRSLHGKGNERYYSNSLYHMSKLDAMPIYSKKTLKSSSLESKGRWSWNLERSITSSCTTVCSYNAPGLTMTYFTARSNLVPYILVWEKIKTMEFSEWKTMEFSEIVVVYDIKVCRYSRLNGYMKHYEYQRTR